MVHFIVTCDGGSRGNHDKEIQSVGYGSFLIEIPGQDAQFAVRKEFGVGISNNEAEYLSLLAALNHIKSAFESAATDLKTIQLTIRTDSDLVIGHLTKGWKVKQHLLPLVDEAKALIPLFSSVTFDKMTGDRMKEVLGH